MPEQDTSDPAKIDIDLLNYVHHIEQAPESCGYLYVPKCEDPDVLRYVNSDLGRKEILAGCGTVDTKSITYSDPFEIVLFEKWEGWGAPSEQETCAAVQLYSNGQPTKIACFVKTEKGDFLHGMDFPNAFAVMASFVNSSEDKPVVLGMGAGTCAQYNGKIYGLHYFEHDNLTEKDVARLKALDYDEVIKINVKQW